MTIEQLREAVQDFYNDTSRSPEQTKEALEDLASDIEAFIESLDD